MRVSTHEISHHKIFMPYSLGEQAIQIIIRVSYRVVSTCGAVIAVECRRLRTESLFARMPKIKRLRESEVCII